MSPLDKSLLAIVEKYYTPIEKEASRSDDDQESFTSAGQNFARGSRLTAMIAVRAVSVASEKSA